jgi:hypothetical protein
MTISNLWCPDVVLYKKKLDTKVSSQFMNNITPLLKLSNHSSTKYRLPTMILY